MGWTQIWDEEKHAYYFHDDLTGNTQWDKPEGFNGDVRRVSARQSTFRPSIAGAFRPSEAMTATRMTVVGRASTVGMGARRSVVGRFGGGRRSVAHVYEYERASVGYAAPGVLLRGYLHKKSAKHKSDEHQINSLKTHLETLRAALAAEYRRRYFALVAFEAASEFMPLIGGRAAASARRAKLPTSPLAKSVIAPAISLLTGGGKLSPAAKAAARRRWRLSLVAVRFIVALQAAASEFDEADGDEPANGGGGSASDEREMHLVWFETEEAFEAWRDGLTPSFRHKGECYKMQYVVAPPAGADGAAAAAAAAPPSNAISAGGALGSLRVKAAHAVRESLRLDLPMRAFEVELEHVTYVLGEDDEYSRAKAADGGNTGPPGVDEWIRVLKACLHGFGALEARRVAGGHTHHDDPLYGQMAGGGGGHGDEASMQRDLHARETLAVNWFADGHHEMGGLGMTHAQKTEEERLEQLTGADLPNKWMYEVQQPLFKPLFLLFCVFQAIWLVTLIFFMNPYLETCDAGVMLHRSGDYCIRESGKRVDECVGWDHQATKLGASRNWAPALQGIGFFPSDAVIDGDEGQTCFRKVDPAALAAYGVFVVAELISVISIIVATALRWRPIRRGARLLSELSPPFHKALWPTVDVLICHYSEPSDETITTLKKALAMEYPPSKLRIIVCDDGYYKSKFNAKQPWPTATLNKGNLANAGDVRHAVRTCMEEMTASGESHDDDDLEALDDFDDADGGSGGARSTAEVTQRKVHDILPDPDDPTRVVPRCDCAYGYTSDDYTAPGQPRVTYSARLKPKVHHSKAGNMNNALYNVGADGQYVVILDNDMEPHPKFLISLLPLFFEHVSGTADGEHHEHDHHHGAPPPPPPPPPTGEVPNPLNGPASVGFDGGAQMSGYTDEVDFNTLAFVQTPQYFKQNELMRLRGDVLSHENSVVYDAGMPAMDGYDSAPFFGTNTMWRREALDSIGGFQYGTISEDFWTGHHAHERGWDSGYLRKDWGGPMNERFRLAEGAVPDSVAASLAQRKRWHKGTVELFLGFDNPRDPEWEPPAARVPPRPVPRHISRWRSLHWANARLSWITTVTPLIYTFLVVGSCWRNTLFISVNLMPTCCVMIPKLLLSTIVPDLADSSTKDDNIILQTHEFFSYAPIRIVGTLEAFYSKVTGTPAAWGNTGAIGRGSTDELFVVFIVVAIIVSLARSLITFLLIDTGQPFSSVFPLWAFAVVSLQAYWQMARVSAQEYFGYSYMSLDGKRFFYEVAPAMIMAVTTILANS